MPINKAKLASRLSALSLFAASQFGNFALASDLQEVRFGLTRFELPSPEGYCKVEEGGTPASIFFEWQREAQLKFGNKLLAFWTDCDWLRHYNGLSRTENLSKWILIVAGLTGPDRREQLFTKISRKDYLDYMLQQSGKFSSTQETEAISRSANQIIKEASKKVLSNPDIVNLGELIPLGIIGVSDSIHVGYIQSIGGQTGKMLVGTVLSSTLIHGAIVHTYFYEEYRNEKTIRNVLHEAKLYSAKLVSNNKD